MPAKQLAYGHHGRAEREDGKGNGTPGATGKERPWHLRCAHRSPHYMTNWDELMVA
ncbi:MAG: DUF4113 domain-containing protein, partial [Pseudomonadota bacterium]